MSNAFGTALQSRVKTIIQTMWKHIKASVKPYSCPVTVEVIIDLTRSKSELILENALLRQPIVVLERQVKRPRLSWIWACDFMQVTDILFRSLFVFIMIELGSRRVHSRQ